jgi:acetyl esterase
MEIDPQMQSILQEIVSAGLPSFADMSPGEARLLPQPVREIEPVAEVENIEAAGPSGPIPLRIYRASEERSPAVVFFHGGGWVLGSIDSYEAFCTRLCNRTGCTVISVGYRLAPEYRFPAGVEDCFAASKWISSNPEHLRVNPSRLAVCGDSAGGNLAAVVSYLARENGGPQLSCQILIYPVASFDETTGSMRQFADGPLLSRKELEWFRDYYLRSLEDGNDPLASPLLIEDLSGLPSALIVTADLDPLRDGGARYAQRLREAGVPVKYTNYPGVFHGFLEHGGRLDPADDSMNEISAFLRDALRGE